MNPNVERIPVMPDTRNNQWNAVACDFSREGLKFKFGMKIWTRIGGTAAAAASVSCEYQINVNINKGK